MGIKIYIMAVWLVVSNIFYFPFHIWDVILPIDELNIFQDGLLHHQPDIFLMLKYPHY